MKKIITVAVISFFMFTSSIVIGAETIKLATLEWEPYIGEKLKNQGYVAEIVIQAFKKSGYQVQIDYMPWARVVKLAEKGTYDGYFPEYYSDSLKESFHVSDAMPGGPLGLFKRKGDTISYTKLKDLTPYKIGVVRGYINTAEFDAADYLNKDEANDDLTNFRKLLKKRIDLVVADKFVGLYVVEQNLSYNLNDIEFIDPPLESKDLFVCISKKSPAASMKIKAFNTGLNAITNDGTVKQILKNHGF